MQQYIYRHNFINQLYSNKIVHMQYLLKLTFHKQSLRLYYYQFPGALLLPSKNLNTIEDPLPVVIIPKPQPPSWYLPLVDDDEQTHSQYLPVHVN